MVVKLQNVRLAFSQNLFRAGSVNGSEPRFSSTFLIPKSNKALLDEIQKTITKVAEEKWKGKAKEVLAQMTKKDMICLHDGEDKSQYDGFEECMYVAASSKVKPNVFDRDRTELVESSGKPYAGCYVNASIDLWAMDNDFGKRINATLRGVQFVRDGDAFVGSTTAKADEFDDLSADEAEGLA